MRAVPMDVSKVGAIKDIIQQEYPNVDWMIWAPNLSLAKSLEDAKKTLEKLSLRYPSQSGDIQKFLDQHGHKIWKPALS